MSPANQSQYSAIIHVCRRHGHAVSGREGGEVHLDLCNINTHKPTSACDRGSLVPVPHELEPFLLEVIRPIDLDRRLPSHALQAEANVQPADVVDARLLVSDGVEPVIAQAYARREGGTPLRAAEHADSLAADEGGLQGARVRRDVSDVGAPIVVRLRARVPDHVAVIAVQVGVFAYDASLARCVQSVRIWMSMCRDE